MPTMTPQIYENKRNELISVLEKIQHECVDLDVATKRELENTENKLKRNSFEIVLVGEFQGGKSTTFNTICDGRPISPMGEGIKTSACKISACSLPEDKEEYVELTWKSDDELLETMRGIIDRNLPKGSKEREIFDKKDEQGNMLASLADKNILDIAQACISREWEVYKMAKDKYDPETEGKLDLLQISTLILKFYNDPGIAQLRACSRVGIDELKKMVVFPSDWLIRWAKGDENTEFDLNEISFVFLGSAFCHIHCKNLERLGCIITDCPGLFAGPWDTRVAMQSMHEADAILYLIGGDKTIKEADLRALNYVLVSKQEHKLFLAINAKQSEKQVKELFRPADYAAMVNRGLKIASPEEIFVFHARMAFNALYGQKNSISEDMDKNLGDDIAKFFAIGYREIAKINEYMDDLPMVYSKSGFPQLLSDIETAIVKRRFEAILVKGGSAKAEKALKTLIGDLEIKEKEASESAQESARKEEIARKALADFQKQVRVLIEGSLGTDVQRNAMKHNYVEEVFMRNTSKMADSITNQIKILFSSSSKLLKIVWDILKRRVIDKEEELDKGELQSLMDSYVRDAVISVAEPAIQGWHYGIVDGKNETFNSSFGLAMENMKMQIRRLWDKAYQGGEGLLNGLDIDIDMENILSDAVLAIEDVKIGGAAMEQQVISVLIKRLMTSLAASLVGTVTIIAVDCLIGAVLLSTIGLIPSLIALFVSGGWMGAKFKEFCDTKINNNLEQKLRYPLLEALGKEFSKANVRTSLEEGANVIIEEIVNKIKERCWASLESQTKSFERRVQENAALHKMAEDEKRRVADKCREVRVQQIEPAATAVQKFNDELTVYFE